MKKIIISIVVLHYNDFEMTKAYIANLKKLNWENITYKIIIVDNCSPDFSGKRLMRYYKDDGHIDIILLNSNIGFAKGNNVGIIKAFSNYKSDLVSVSNNDIIIEDRLFMQKLNIIYSEKKFDIMGPDIFSTRRHFHQSPIRDEYLSKEQLEEFIRVNRRKLVQLRIIDKMHVYDLLSYIKKRIKGNPKNCKEFDNAQNGVVLQGAFFVLAKKYYEIYPDGLFPDTFLYMEEDILNYRAKKANLNILYDPELSVKHLEGASTIRKSGNRCKKYIFEIEQTIKSAIIMKKYLDE